MLIDLNLNLHWISELFVPAHFKHLTLLTSTAEVLQLLLLFIRYSSSYIIYAARYAEYILNFQIEALIVKSSVFKLYRKQVYHLSIGWFT